eukprot:1152789-Pelagomonas_calceolata.AAC.5
MAILNPCTIKAFMKGEEKENMMQALHHDYAFTEDTVKSGNQSVSLLEIHWPERTKRKKPCRYFHARESLNYKGGRIVLALIKKKSQGSGMAGTCYQAKPNESLEKIQGRGIAINGEEEKREVEKQIRECQAKSLSMDTELTGARPGSSNPRIGCNPFQ